MRLFSEKKESIVDVAVVLGRFEVRGAVRNPGFLMVAEENICKGGTEGLRPIPTPSVWE